MSPDLKEVPLILSTDLTLLSNQGFWLGDILKVLVFSTASVQNLDLARLFLR